MITVITDRSEGEPDIMVGLSQRALTIRSLDDVILRSFIPPIGGWTHESIESTCNIAAETSIEISGGANAFLGGQWVGGTEV